jgi:hypothetical protein
MYSMRFRVNNPMKCGEANYMQNFKFCLRIHSHLCGCTPTRPMNFTRMGRAGLMPGESAAGRARSSRGRVHVRLQ